MARELRYLFPRSRTHDALKEVRHIAANARGRTSDADNDFARIERIAAAALYPMASDDDGEPASRKRAMEEGPDQ